MCGGPGGALEERVGADPDRLEEETPGVSSESALIRRRLPTAAELRDDL